MNNSILPHKYPTQNCIENCFSNLCDANGIEYAPMFVYSWDIGYDKSKINIGERIHYNQQCKNNFEQYFKVAKQFLNLSLENVDITNSELVEMSKNGSVFLVATDSYRCEWSSAYQKYHYPHYILVTGSNAETGHLYGIDSFSTNDIITLNIKDLKNADVKYVSVASGNEVLNKHRIKDEFMRFLSSNVKRDLINVCLQQFIDDLNSIDSIRKISPSLMDISNSHIIRRLSYIANSRYNSMILMKYLEYNERYISSMESIYRKWDTLKNCFVKMLLLNNLKVSPAINLISAINKSESELSNFILGSC